MVLQGTGLKPIPKHFHLVDSQKLIFLGSQIGFKEFRYRIAPRAFRYRIASREFRYRIVSREFGYRIASRDSAILKFSIRLLASEEFIFRRPHSWSRTLYLEI